MVYSKRLSYLVLSNLSVPDGFSYLFNIYLFVCFVYTSMGDNLLLMDSPAPRARSSVLPGHLINRGHALLEQADSPCGVDRLLNFSPRVNEVNILSWAPIADDCVSE